MTGAVNAADDGLRTRNKLEKLRRIKEAAQTLFVAKGFDDTTMREIALRAGVGLGTIFLYAKDKRDLLFLTINEPLRIVTQRAENVVDPKAPLIDNLLSVAKTHYQFFGQQPALARIALREMIFYDSGAQAASFQKTRERFIRLFGHIIELAIANKEIAPSVPPMFAGWIVFCIYQVEQRRWLADDVTNLGAGLRELERALGLLIAGFGICAQPVSKRSRKGRERKTSA